MKAPEGQEVVNVRLPRDLHDQLRAVSIEEERSMSATLRVALRRYLAARGYDQAPADRVAEVDLPDEAVRAMWDEAKPVDE